MIHFNDSKFINCISLNGGGGAIYINNSIEVQNDIIFNNLTFRNCKATFGGAVVIYSIYDLNNVSFNYCEFHSNRVNEKNLNKNNDFQGGSGAFLCAKNMHVYKCNFVENKGSLGALKLYNKFNEDKTKMKRNNYLDYNQKSIVVSNCNFELNDDSKTSIYYENGKHHSMIDIIDCNFYSKKNRQNSHIDGKEWNLDSSKVSIKSCNFQKANSHLYATLTIMLIIFAVISIVISLVIHNVNHLKFQF